MKVDINFTASSLNVDYNHGPSIDVKVENADFDEIVEGVGVDNILDHLNVDEIISFLEGMGYEVTDE